MANRVFHEEGVMRKYNYNDANQAYRTYMINPEWVEALMGYPTGWTGT